MKNLVIGILVLILVVVGYYTATTTLRLRLEGLEGKTEKVIRGDLTLPINATGSVRPALRVEIKSEASGEVIEIAREPGDRIRVGDLLIRLQKDDEQRSVDRASQDLAIAQARLETARIRLDLAKNSDLKNAQAQVDQLSPMVELAKFRMDKIEAIEKSLTSEEEILARRVEFARQDAQLDAAIANFEKAKLAIPLTEQSVIEAEAAHQAAQASLGDAKKRLQETDVTSPIDGVVADIKTQIGAVIQGGKTTFTGGTVLAVVIDMDQVLVEAEVDESDIGRVLEIAPPWARPGRESDLAMPSSVEEALALVEHPPVVTVESFRDVEFTGIVQYIKPEPESRSGVVTYIVDVLVTGDERRLLLPGMRADVSFTSEQALNVVLCPNEAIRREGPAGRLGVYVPQPGSTPREPKFEFVECKFGLDNGIFSEVRSGLTEGMEVYTKLPAQDRGDSGRRR